MKRLSCFLGQFISACFVIGGFTFVGHMTPKAVEALSIVTTAPNFILRNPVYCKLGLPVLQAINLWWMLTTGLLLWACLLWKDFWFSPTAASKLNIGVVLGLCGLFCVWVYLLYFVVRYSGSASGVSA